MDDRAMRGEQRASHTCGGAVPARLVGVEPSVVVVAESELGILGELGAEAFDLRRRPGEIDRAALRVVAVDPLGGDDATDLVDRVVHRQLQGSSPPRVRGGDQRSSGSSAAAPSTIRRCVRWRRTPRSPVRARRSAASDRLPRGSSRSTAPVRPAPTITTSKSESPGSGSKLQRCASGSVSFHNEGVCAVASTVARRTAIRYASSRSVIAPWPMTQLPPPSIGPSGLVLGSGRTAGLALLRRTALGAADRLRSGTDHARPAGRAAPVAPARRCGRCTCNPVGIVGRRPVVDRRAVALRVAAHRVRRAADGGGVRTFRRVVLVRQPSLGDRAAERRRGAAVPLERRSAGVLSSGSRRSSCRSPSPRSSSCSTSR